MSAASNAPLVKPNGLILSAIRLLVALMAAGITACQKPAPEVKKQGSADGAMVTVAPTETIRADRSLPIVGTLFPKDEATLCAEVEGRVEKTTVDFGDRITNGQAIAFIDTTAYAAVGLRAAAEVARAKATLANAEQNLRRTAELRKVNIASVSDFDKATAEAEEARAILKSAEASQTIAELNVSRSQLKVPFDAAVTERLAGPGDFVHVGTPLFRIVNDRLIKYITSVPERFAGEVKKDQVVNFTVDQYPGRTFEGRVLLISPAVNTKTRAFPFGVLVRNPELTLKANAFARGELIIERDVPVLVVPVEAVVNFAGVTKAFVVENGIAHVREVQVGRIKDGKQQILSGLKAGDSVVVTGHGKLREGSKVTVRSAEGTAAKPGQ